MALCLGLSCLALVVAACGGSDDAGTSAPLTSGGPPAETVPPATLGPVPDIGTGPGSALVFLPDGAGGTTQLALDVDACTITPDATPDGEVPAELLGAAASGATDDGTEVRLDVRRFRSQGASPTITDTVTIVFGDPDAPERALVAQRFEVDGLVSDLRDPTAGDPLLVVGPGGFEGRGVFGPPGSDVEADDLVEGVVRAACDGG